MTKHAEALVGRGVLDEVGLEVLRRGLRAWTSMAVCGGSEPERLEILAFLLEELGERDHVLGIGPESLGGRTCVAVPAGESADRALRAALRQDPDCLAVDDRALDSAPLVWTAMTTGHRVLVALGPRPAAEGLADFVRRAGGEAGQEYVVASMLGGAFAVVELGGPRAALWQPARGEDGALALEPLGEIPEPAPWIPPAEDFSELELPEDWPERSEPVLSSLRARLGPLRRRAWAPVLGEGSGTSRFGGRPVLAAGEPWPRCGSCAARMALVVQLDLATVPDEVQARLGSQGWFQFFYCASDDCSVAEAWAPFSDNSLSRVLSAGVPSEEERLLEREAAIVEWVPLEDYPHGEELRGLPADERRARELRRDFEEILRDTERGRNLARRWRQYLERFGLQDAADLAEVARLGRTWSGDKLLGWPSWSQGVETPSCRRCGAPMQLLLQVNNDGHEGGEPGERSFFGQLFAADGNGHVFGCPTHPDEQTFAWACG